MRIVSGRPALFLAIGVGVAVGLALPDYLPLAKRFLLGWCLGTALYVGYVSWKLSRLSTAAFRKKVAELDDGAIAILILSMLATLVSFGAVIVELSTVKSIPSGEQALALGLMVVTIIFTWLFLQTVFAIHYAHVFYLHHRDGQVSLDFGGEDNPDYWDFVYFAVAIGASSATSDVNLRSRTMRRLVMAHATYSFFFNAMVLALGINIAAGLLGG